jgi:hypothetical protein
MTSHEIPNCPSLKPMTSHQSHNRIRTPQWVCVDPSTQRSRSRSEHALLVPGNRHRERLSVAERWPKGIRAVGIRDLSGFA